MSRTTLADVTNAGTGAFLGLRPCSGAWRKPYQSDAIAVELSQPLYAFDSTTIDLCLSLFPWAEFRKTKAAVKMHTVIDLRDPSRPIAITTVGPMSGWTICRSKGMPSCDG
jgi:hypothetical protein